VVFMVFSTEKAMKTYKYNRLLEPVITSGPGPRRPDFEQFWGFIYTLFVI
jgi:hypothetical protein